MNTQERFWSKVLVSESLLMCWPWTASHCAGGYGQFHLDGRMAMAHQVAYEAVIGPVPAGLEIDHLCKVRDCCNPYHLEPVTHEENIERSDVGIVNASKTHCPTGHPYAGENLFIRKRGGRECRTCMREQLRRSRARAKD